MDSSTASGRIGPARTYRNHHLDSTRWEHFTPRPGDVVITTPYKSGTTWMQQIVTSLLLWPQPPSPDMHERSAWLDARFHGPVEEVIAELEAQDGRRCIKTHLPADGLPRSDDVSYILVGRDLRDVFLSLWNHYSGHTDHFFTIINDDDRPGPPFPRPPADPRAFWAEWTTRGWFPWESDGWPYWSPTHHLATWWELRDLPNVLAVHYADLSADPVGEMQRVAAFLGLSIDDDAWPALVENASLDAMRRNAARRDEASGGFSAVWREGSATFFNQGTNGRWRSVLRDEDLELYERLVGRLAPDLRAWLEGGRAATT